MKNELQIMPGVEWVVATEETLTPAKDLVGAPTMELALVPTKELVDTLVAEDAERIVTSVSSIRPWARPLLNSSLVIAVTWLVAFAFSLLSTSLFSEVRTMLGIAGFPITLFVAIAFMADPGYESPDHEEFVPWLFDNEGSYAASMCSPSRHALTGRDQ